MKQLILLIGFFLLHLNLCTAQDYSSKLINDSLKLNADAVIRYEQESITIENTGFVKNHEIVITILNKNGDDFAMFKETINPFVKINNATATLYDQEGKAIKTANKQDFESVLAFGNSYTFLNEERFLVFDFKHRNYPYTVKYKYESNVNSLWFLPIWAPQKSNTLAVEKSIFEIKKSQLKNPLFFKTNNFKNTSFEKSETNINTDKIYKFEVGNLKAFNFEVYADHFNQLPRLDIVAESVKLNEFIGDMKTWQSFGDFILKINSGKDNLSQTDQAIFQKMVDTISNPKSKVAFLYKYLQKNNRYLLNTKGILGWQAISASDVKNAGYGDCKGLSILMKAMLKAVGIASYLTLVHAGDDFQSKIDINFPQNIFNHMILCVPLGKDTIWLENTSNEFPAGYLGDFSGGRKVLVLENGNSKIVQSPTYNKTVNYLNITTNLNIDTLTSFQQIEWMASYAGLLQMNLNSSLKSSISAFDKVAEYSVPYKNVTIISHNYEWNNEHSFPIINENLKFKVNNLLQTTSNRYIVAIPIKKINLPILESIKERSKPFEFNYEYAYQFEYNIQWQEGLKLENTPKNININNEFGNFSIEYIPTNNKLKVNLKCVLYKGNYDVSKYQKYLAFYNEITKYSKSLSIYLIK